MRRHQPTNLSIPLAVRLTAWKLLWQRLLGPISANEQQGETIEHLVTEKRAS